MSSSFRYFGIPVMLACLMAGTFLLSGTYTEDEKNNQSFEENYKIHSLELPEYVEFAGEKISLDDPDLLERYDKELLTNIYWQSQTLLFIKRAGRYLPVIEEILKQQGIPSDFKYLAVAESGLQYQALSPSNAAGYWQFLEGTAKRYGLIVTEEVDERYHLEKSTVAACAYFKEAFEAFGNWPLVAASYNMGIEGVRKQLLTQKAASYHDLYLNSETSRYLFRIIAIKTILENPDRYGFQVPYEQVYKPVKTYRVKVTANIPDIPKYATDNKVSYKWIRLLNPWLRKYTLNANGNTYYLSLPVSQKQHVDYASLIRNDTIGLEQTHFTP